MVVQARVLKSVADDLFAAGRCHELERLVDLLRLAVFDASVQVFFVLAHDHHFHQRVLGVDGGVVAGAGAHVGKQAQRFANGHVQAFVAAALGGGDGGFVKYLVIVQDFPRFFVNAAGFAAQVDLFANFDGVNFQFCAGLQQNAQAGFHDFGANAVTIGNGDGGFCHSVCSLQVKNAPNHNPSIAKLRVGAILHRQVFTP